MWLADRLGLVHGPRDSSRTSLCVAAGAEGRCKVFLQGSPQDRIVDQVAHDQRSQHHKGSQGLQQQLDTAVRTLHQLGRL